MIFEVGQAVRILALGIVGAVVRVQTRPDGQRFYVVSWQVEGRTVGRLMAESELEVAP